MRLSGQGLMSHTATTTISRYFERSRGRASKCTTWLGLSLAEFILPLLIVFLLTILRMEKYLVINFNFGSHSGLTFKLLFYLVKNISLDSREKSRLIKNKIVKKI